MSNRVGSEKKWGNISIYQGTGLLYALPQKTVTLFIGTIKSEVWLLSITNKLDLSLSIFTQYHHAFFHHRERRVFNYFFHCYAWLHLVVRWCEQVQHLYFPEISFYSHAESKGLLDSFPASLFQYLDTQKFFAPIYILPPLAYLQWTSSMAWAFESCKYYNHKHSFSSIYGIGFDTRIMGTSWIFVSVFQFHMGINYATYLKPLLQHRLYFCKRIKQETNAFQKSSLKLMVH